jgi:hypothetical protein
MISGFPATAWFTVVAWLTVSQAATAYDLLGAYPEMRHATFEMRLCFLNQPRLSYDAGYIDSMIKACSKEINEWTRLCNAVLENSDCRDLAARQFWEIIRP